MPYSESGAKESFDYLRLQISFYRNQNMGLIVELDILYIEL
jgi:hypothetical protein